MLGFSKREFFEIEDAGDREAPAVSFHAAALRRVTLRARSGLRSSRAARARRSRSPARPRRKSFTLAAGRRRACRWRRTARCSSTSSIQYAFSGPFSGGYREIPLRPGESVSDVVGARERPAVPAGRLHRARLHRRGRAPSASRDLGGQHAHRLALRAADEARTFEIRYTLRGLAVAYDDVVDVNLKVWGDEWKVGLGKLTATLDAPGKVVRAWGHPVVRPRRRAARGQPGRCCARSTSRRTSSSSCAR